jgi:hypothetical protein
MRRRSYLLAVLLLAAPPLAAQPASGERRVNSTQTGSQVNPRIAAGGDGFVIVWRGPGAGSDDVFWRTVNVVSSVSPDPDFRVNGYVTGGQGAPDVASLPNYGWVVVWQGAGPGAATGIFGQRYSSNGNPAGASFDVSVSVDAGAGSPSVASRPDGSFVVAWQEYVALPRTWVLARRFSAAGSPVGSVFAVTDPVTASQSRPSVAAWPGGFVVVWTADGYATDDARGVFERRFYEDGSPAAGVFHVNMHTTGNQDTPSVGGKGDGTFVVTWQSTTQDGDGSAIRARHYAAGGLPSSEFGVNTYATADQTAPRIAVDANGGYMIVWNSAGQDGDFYGIYAQRFDELGHRLGGEFAVNVATAGSQALPAVAASVTNHYHMVAWEGPDADTYGIYVRSYCLKGDANGDATVDIADVFYIINDLFAGGPISNCSDVNEDGMTDIADVFYLINYLFASGPAPF